MAITIPSVILEAISPMSWIRISCMISDMDDIIILEVPQRGTGGYPSGLISGWT